MVLSAQDRGEHGVLGSDDSLSYFFLSGAVIARSRRPSWYIARTQKLEGDFRRMHSRLITRGGWPSGRRQAGEDILDAKLDKTTTWSSFYFYLQFKQGVIDQYFVKWHEHDRLARARVPVPGGRPPGPRLSCGAVQGGDTLIQSASSSIGDLMMVSRSFSGLRGSRRA